MRRLRMVLGAIIISGALAASTLACHAQNVVHVANISTFRSADYSATPTIYLDGYRTNGDGGEGMLVFNSSDTTSSDNGCTIFIDSNSHRFYRQNLQGGLSVNQCGAYGDDTHDDASAFNTAFGLSAHVRCQPGSIYAIKTLITVSIVNVVFDAKGCKLDPQMAARTDPIMNIAADHFTGNDIFIRGGDPGGYGIEIGATTTVNNTTFNNFTCDGSDNAPGAGNCIFIWSANNVVINTITIASENYGVISESGQYSNVIYISNIRCTDMYAYCVDENTGSAGTSNWNIDGWYYGGAHSYPTLSTSDNGIFAFTGSNGILIENGYGKNTAGDSCFHFEAAAKNISLKNNTLANCLTEGGNSGFIYYTNSNNNITSVGTNCTDSSTDTGTGTYCFSGAGNSLGNTLTFNSDTCTDSTGTFRFSCYDLTGHSGPTVINATQAFSVNLLVSTFNTSNLTLVNTRADQIQSGINGGQQTTSGGAGINGLTLIGNNWLCHSVCLSDGKNMSGTDAPQQWVASGNTFNGVSSGDGNVVVTSLVQGYSTGEYYGQYLSTYTFASSPGANTTEKNDFLYGVGLIH